jgi:hypothetical protein
MSNNMDYSLLVPTPACTHIFYVPTHQTLPIVVHKFISPLSCSFNRSPHEVSHQARLQDLGALVRLIDWGLKFLLKLNNY